jgi:addiction module RelE/StbE family toxin
MSKIVFSPEAISDLEQIKEYIAEELSETKASLKIVSEILKHIRQLDDFPLSGASLSSIVEMDTDYRFLVCGKYTTFYRFEDEIVYVVRVLYSRRDFMRILLNSQDDNMMSEAESRYNGIKPAYLETTGNKCYNSTR